MARFFGLLKGSDSLGIVQGVPANRHSEKIFLVVACVFLVFVVFVSFFPSLDNDFTNYDDGDFLTNNPLVKHLSWENTVKIFTCADFDFLSVPLTILSFNIEYHFFGLNPFVYHATNLILHILNCLLVLWIIYLLAKKNLLVALITALLFGIHPLRVESVAWITERKDVLYAFFFLLSILTYIYYIRKRCSGGFYFLSVIFFALSVCSKPMAITLPLVLFLLDFLLKRPWNRELFKEKILYFAICFLLLLWIFTLISSHKAAGTGGMHDYFLFRLQQPLFLISTIVFYLSKIVWPADLSFCYQFSMEKSYWDYSRVILPSIFGIGIILAVIYYGRQRPKLYFGSLFYLVTIMPILFALPVADRFTYVPAIGIFYLFGEALSWVYYQKYKNAFSVRLSLIFSMIFMILFFSYLTWNLCKEWKNSLTLWNGVIKQYPRCPLAYFGRGTYYHDQGQSDRALADFNRAEQIFLQAGAVPKADLYYNRGCIYRQKADAERAMADYDRSIQIDPTRGSPYNGRAAIYADSGEVEKALIELDKAIGLDPNNGEFYANRAVILFYNKNFSQSLKDAQRATALGYKLKPEIIRALYYESGNADQVRE